MSDDLSTLVVAPWESAAKALIEMGLKDGDIITHNDLIELFGLKQPPEKCSKEEYRDFQLKYFSYLQALREFVLTRHQLYLDSIYGTGYRVVPAKEQTELGVKQFFREFARSYKKAQSIVSNVRVEELTQAERKENSDAAARLATIATLTRRAANRKILMES